MSDLLQEIKDLKTQAKNRRDLKRFDRAARMLQQAIGLAANEHASTSVAEWRATLASELADCWGILGGVERRWALELRADAEQQTAHFQKSIAAYDQGYGYERDPALGGSTSTYNRLNRLLVRLLHAPERFQGEDPADDREPDGTPVKVRPGLETIADELKPRGSETVWTAADLALLEVLLGRQDAAAAYARFEKMRPADFACQSAHEGVAPLAALDIPTAPELKRAEQLLKALWDRMRTH